MRSAGIGPPRHGFPANLASTSYLDYSAGLLGSTIAANHDRMHVVVQRRKTAKCDALHISVFATLTISAEMVESTFGSDCCEGVPQSIGGAPRIYTRFLPQAKLGSIDEIVLASRLPTFASGAQRADLHISRRKWSGTALALVHVVSRAHVGLH